MPDDLATTHHTLTLCHHTHFNPHFHTLFLKKRKSNTHGTNEARHPRSRAMADPNAITYSVEYAKSDRSSVCTAITIAMNISSNTTRG